jgi:hypothetical protein
MGTRAQALRLNIFFYPFRFGCAMTTVFFFLFMGHCWVCLSVQWIGLVCFFSSFSNTRMSTSTHLNTPKKKKKKKKKKKPGSDDPSAPRLPVRGISLGARCTLHRLQYPRRRGRRVRQRFCPCFWNLHDVRSQPWTPSGNVPRGSHVRCAGSGAARTFPSCPTATTSAVAATMTTVTVTAVRMTVVRMTVVRMDDRGPARAKAEAGPRRPLCNRSRQRPRRIVRGGSVTCARHPCGGATPSLRRH